MDKARRHSARGMARDAENAGNEFVEQARRRSTELLNDAERTGRRAWRDVRSWVEDNPVPVAAAAFLAGLAVYGWLERRRGSGIE